MNRNGNNQLKLALEMGKFKVAIIGAGATGLVALKHCVNSEFEVTCFEQSSSIGGLWRYVPIDDNDKTNSPFVYRSVITNTSNPTTGFSDFPMPSDWPTFLPHRLMDKYYESYAEHFNLYKHIKLNTIVICVSKLTENNRWQIKYKPKSLTNISQDEEEQQEEFDYVIVCSGRNYKPRMPEFLGQDLFGGKQMHSQAYKDIHGFEDKRIVVVGNGSSGIEIAVELSRVASQVYLCTREGTIPHVFPRLRDRGRPLDQFATRFLTYYVPKLFTLYQLRKILKSQIEIHKQRGLAKQKPEEFFPGKQTFAINSEFYERLLSGTISVKLNIRELRKDSSIVLVDNTILENIDTVIYATGYDMGFGFIDENSVRIGRNRNKEPFINGDSIRVNQEGEDNCQSNDFTWLYKMMFPPHCPNIAFLGVFETAGSHNMTCELQARYISALITGKISPLPTPEEMQKALESQTDCSRVKTIIDDSGDNSEKKLSIKADWWRYNDSLAKEVGCYPKPSKILLKFGFRMWKQLLFGVPTSVQYRLCGLDSWHDASEWMNIHNS
ncbi:12342_t:CDS:2 [Ambispora gerdemannii]|uniref:Flavin-containing monooxygenase 1 n=1 Tax=Ambispora gerdemannii TaxID=144530 RepID=A0A9N9GCG3_9GLOM|nr:12342_t:CDS:2 [Ambispora gerdemannii]